MAEFQRDTQINIFAVFMESHYTPFLGKVLPSLSGWMKRNLLSTGFINDFWHTNEKQQNIKYITLLIIIKL